MTSTKLLLIAICAAGVLLLATAPAAPAATYRVTQCSGQVGAPDAQKADIGLGATFADFCPIDGLGLRASANTTSGGAVSVWGFEAPAATQFVAASALARGQGEGGCVSVAGYGRDRRLAGRVRVGPG